MVPRPSVPPAARLPLLLLGAVALVVGVGAGLARLGIAVPALAQGAAGHHGPLLAAVFFGVVIGLERAVALQHPVWYVAPLASGLAGVALLGGFADLAPALALLGALVFLAGSLVAWRRMPGLFTVTLALGALAGLTANGFWLSSGRAAEAVVWWMAFFVLTIAGERLELTRLLPPRPLARHLFVALLVALGLSLGVVVAQGATSPLAAVLLGVALWLASNDVARRNLRQRGLPRFAGVCLLSGYAALALGAALGLAGAFDPGHPWRDAALHCVFLGFVFAMVIGHAPIVFPAVMRVKIPYHAAFYLPLALLHGGLLLRVFGVLTEHAATRRFGALGNAAALALLVATLLWRVGVGRKGAAP